MTKNSIPAKITQLASAIIGLITTHENKTGSSLQKGHVRAGGAPQTIGESLSAGTDNGYYARADHVHTVSYNNISEAPSASTTLPSADTTNGSYGTGTNYARVNHTHPKSLLYAEATHSHTKNDITNFSHTHDDRYYTETEVNNLIQQERNKILLISPNVLQKGDNISIKTIPIENNCIQVGKKNKIYGIMNVLRGVHYLSFSDSFGRTAQTYTQTNDKLSIIGKSNGGMTAPLNIDTTGDYTIEFKVKGTGSGTNGIRFDIQSTKATSIEQYILAINYEASSIRLDYSNTSTTHYTVRNQQDENEHNVKFEIIGNSAKMYFDNTQYLTINDLTWLHDELQITVHSWGNAINLDIYDFKIT